MQDPQTIEFKFESPQQSPGYLLAQLTLLWQRKQKKALDELDITHTQFVLLSSIAFLSKSSSEVTQIDIANLNNYDRMMVSKVLRTLEIKALIKRTEHNTDTRAKIVVLTPSGTTILQSALTKVENSDMEFFYTLKDDLPGFNKSMLELIKANK